MKTNEITIHGNKEGNYIIVKLQRGLVEEHINLDGHDCGSRVTGTVDLYGIEVFSGGKRVASGYDYYEMPLNDSNYSRAIANGCTHKVGRDAYLKHEHIEKINAAKAQLDADNPISDAQIEYEAKEIAKLEAEINYLKSDECKRHEQLKRDMEEENSIY